MAPSTDNLEREYNARLAVPEYPQWFSAWRDASAHARKTLDARLDLPFDSGPNGTTDYFPTKDNMHRSPCMVFIHGGYWRSMDKSDFSFIAPSWVDRGVHVLIPNYMLCPQATLHGIVGQMRGFYQWLGDKADALRIDPNRIMLVGHSAGAHLAAMILADPALCAPRVMVGLSGIYDLLPLLQTSINADIGLDASMAKSLSPQHMPRPAKDFHLQLYAGELESGAFHQQRTAFGQAWGAEIHDALRGLHHFSILDALKNPQSDLFRHCFDRTNL